MVRIRMKRTGTRNCACFRIVVADIRKSRDGRSLENLGTYDPRLKTEKIDLERFDYWVSMGARPTETVLDIAERARTGKKLSEIPKKQKPSKKTVAKQKKADEEAAKQKEQQEAAPANA